MGVVSNIFKQAGRLAAPARQTLASSKAILSKNALIVGDDLAVKTERSIGIMPEREGPALWKSTMGALKNRAIIWPIGLGVSVAFPALITPALLVGAGYLCYEVAHVVAGVVSTNGHGHDDDHQDHDSPESYEEFEKKKIDSFVRTDFVMAMETTAIGLGEVGHLPILTRAASFGIAGMALLAGVSTAVFGLLKLDDLGKFLSEREGDNIFRKSQRGLGNGILKTAPWLMKTLSVVGVGAMLVVGGGMLVHNIPFLYAMSHGLAHAAHGVPMIGGILESAAPIAFSAASGLVAGFGILAAKPVVAAAYDKTLRPVVNFVSGLAGKAKAAIFKKGQEPEPTATAEAESHTAAITNDAIQSAMDIEAPVLTAEPTNIAAEMAKAAAPDGINDNTQPVPSESTVDTSQPKAIMG